jgi:hypothetical protein
MDNSSPHVGCIGGSAALHVLIVQMVQPNCTPGNATVMIVGPQQTSMYVSVPGGQQAYLDVDGTYGYTQAHSAMRPQGSVVGGFAAFQGGGLVNLNPGALGWVACPSTVSSGGGAGVGRFKLVAKNETNAPSLKDCTAVNLKANEWPSNLPAVWQYS